MLKYSVTLMPRHSEAQSLSSEEARWAYNRVSTVTGGGHNQNI